MVVEQPEKSSTVESQSENQWDESVSVLMDNEPTEFDPLNLDMPYGRQVWDQYHLIGDVMRDKDLAFQPSDMFYARLSKALEQEPAHTPKGNSLWPWGLSLAASLLLSVGVWVFTMGGEEQATEMGARETSIVASNMAVGASTAPVQAAPQALPQLGEGAADLVKSTESTAPQVQVAEADSEKLRPTASPTMDKPASSADQTVQMAQAPGVATSEEIVPAMAPSSIPSIQFAVDTNKSLLIQEPLQSIHQGTVYVDLSQAVESSSGLGPQIAQSAAASAYSGTGLQAARPVARDTSKTTSLREFLDEDRALTLPNDRSGFVAREQKQDMNADLLRPISAVTNEQWRENFKNLIKQQNRLMGVGLSVPSGLRGAIEP